VQIDLGAPVFAVLDRAFREVTGRGTVAIRAGGSIPSCRSSDWPARRWC